MADILGVVRRLVWFAIGFAAVATFALRMETADAAACTHSHTTLSGWDSACAANEEYLTGANASSWTRTPSSCTISNVPYPSCGRQSVSNSTNRFEYGFIGACPAAGTPGPTYGGNYPSTGSPALTCAGACKTTNSGGLELCLDNPDGTQYCTGGTTYTGDRCIPSAAVPNISNPPPETCTPANQIDGDCLTLSDSDSNPLQTPLNGQICIGDVCRSLPGPPLATEGCEHGADSALCNGLPWSVEPGALPGSLAWEEAVPDPNNPPYPASQSPSYSTSVSTPNGPIPVDIFGPAERGNAGPPDANGNCPSGTSNVGGSCLCPVGRNWNGTSCDGSAGPPDDGTCPGGAAPVNGDCLCPSGQTYNGTACVDGGEEDGVCDEQAQSDPDCEGREGESGTCGSEPPACSGDEIDCSIVFQTWATRCALVGTENAPDIDLDSDPLAQYGGPDAMFETDSANPGDLDASGWLGGGSCPTMASINVLGKVVAFEPVWCELYWLGTLLVALAYLIAVRIVYGE